LEGAKGARDLHPTVPSQRVLRWSDLVWLWFGMTAQMGVFALGANFAGRITYWEAIAAILIGNLVVGILCVTNGDIGTEHGVGYAVYLRAAYGQVGSILPSLLRGSVAVCWFGIQTFFGATAIDISVKYLTGYSNWWLWYALFGVLQIAITAYGIQWIKYLENAAAPLLTVLCIWVIYTFLGQKSFGEFVATPITNRLPFWAAVVANLSYWITVADNIPDFTRFVRTGQGERNFIRRNLHSILGQLPGLAIGMIVFATVGMVGKVVTGYGNPVEAIGATFGGYLMIIGLAIILLAQLTTNVAANLYAPGYVLASVTQARLTFAAGVVLAGVFGLVFTMPWKLVDAFLVYLPAVGAALSPVAGIMFADYYLIRRRRLITAELFDPHGQYWYWNGINPAALIAHGIGSWLGIVYLKYSWLVSVPVTIVLYVALMHFWVLSRYPQKELAVPAESSAYLGNSVA
jgi:nucleobase:cation symporter-1, NCS1 family